MCIFVFYVYLNVAVVDRYHRYLIRIAAMHNTPSQTHRLELTVNGIAMLLLNLFLRRANTDRPKENMQLWHRIHSKQAECRALARLALAMPAGTR